MSTIVVTGGTGVLGRQVVRRLAASEHVVRSLSRKAGPEAERVIGDLSTGAGVDAALAGVDAVIHCATNGMTADLQSTKNLLATAEKAGVPLIIYISIVGVDKIAMRYYRTKLEVEEFLLASAMPTTILRTTQFHEFFPRMATGMAKSPVAMTFTKTSFQPVDSGEVADRLIALALQPAQGRVDELGGPDVVPMRELIEKSLRLLGKRRLIVPVHIPGGLGRGYRAGLNLTLQHADGRRTFDDFIGALND